MDEEHQERFVKRLWTHQKIFYMWINRILTALIVGLMISVAVIFRVYQTIGKRSAFALLICLECDLLESVRPRTFSKVSYVGLAGFLLVIFKSSSHDGRVLAIVSFVAVLLQNYLKYSMKSDYEEISGLEKYKSSLKGA